MKKDPQFSEALANHSVASMRARWKERHARKERKKQVKKARETLELFVPLAEHMGVSSFADELRSLVVDSLIPAYNAFDCRERDVLLKKIAAEADQVGSSPFDADGAASAARVRARAQGDISPVAAPAHDPGGSQSFRGKVSGTGTGVTISSSSESANPASGSWARRASAAINLRL